MLYDTPLNNSAADWQIYIIDGKMGKKTEITIRVCVFIFINVVSTLAEYSPFSFRFLISLHVETNNKPTHRDHHFWEPRKVMCGKFWDLRQQQKKEPNRT